MQYLVFFDQNGTLKASNADIEASWLALKKATGIGSDVTWPAISFTAS